VRRRRWRWVPVLFALVGLASACSEPEPGNYALTVTSIEGATVCGEGPDTDEALCFESDQLEIIDGAELHLDDCVTVDVDVDDDNRVTRAYWDGRCSTEPVQLGVTLRDGVPRVLIPDCLSSLTSLRLEDEAGERVWSVARETSTEHPLLDYVELDTIPPGFAERDPFTEPDEDETLHVTANQQITALPPGTVSFSTTELGDDIVTDGETYATPEEFLAAAGCRSE
jgi:hypothetical protein